ncbi:MAG: ATP-binding protein [Pseudobdellovibrionaceae bacterium]
MVLREFWRNRVGDAWSRASIVWLQGVRRSGKTTFVKSLKEASYFNCDLPSVQKELSNPELFLKQNKSKIIVFDEIHQLPEASMILKIAADEFPKLKVLATGSSSLVAGKKFKDTLTGRKRNIHFLPVLIDELAGFNANLEKRMHFGGLPPALLSKDFDDEFYGEWLDSFYARDIQELFAVEKRQPFIKALEYLLSLNSKQFDVSKLAQVCGVSRPTLIKYLDILEVTNAITVLRPFSKNSEQEIVSQPKVYGFDTGFCCYAQGIENLESPEKGQMLENLTLETLQAYGFSKGIKYWRTKTKNEIDFILEQKRDKVITIECKWKEKTFSTDAIEIFRKNYPHGENLVITSDSHTRVEEYNNLKLKFINIFDLPQEIALLSAK